MKDLDLLRNIVTGGNTSEVDPDQIYTNQQNKEAEEVINSFSHLTPEKRYERWRGWSKNKQLEPEFKWSKDEELYPGVDFRGDITKEIDLELKVQRSNEDKYNFFQRELSKWPSWLQDNYKNQAANSLPYRNQSELSDARKNNKIETRETTDILKETLVGLSGTKSSRAHTEDLAKALKLDYEAKQIHVNEEGHISVPIDGNMVPIYSIPEAAYPQNSPMEDFILKRDTYGILEETIKPIVFAAQNDINTATRAKNRMMFRKLGDDPHGDLEEFELDIIYNAAMDELDRDKVVSEGLNIITKRDIPKFASPFDAVASYLQKAHKLGNLFERRQLDDRTT